MTFEQQRQDYVDALGWVADLMAGTTSAQLGGPTPCDAFDVRLLMGHLIGTARRGLGTAERVSTRDVPHIVTDVRDEAGSLSRPSRTGGILLSRLGSPATFSILPPSAASPSLLRSSRPG